MGKRLGGTCYIKCDGTQFEVKGGVEVPLTDFKREAVTSTGGAVGYKETVEVPYIKLTAIFMPDFPLAAIKAGTDMTLTAELANGKVYTLSGAWLADAPSLKVDDGETELTFNGTRGEFL